MMVRIELEATLDTIASGVNLRVVVFKLLTWAERWDRVADLIEGAYRQNSSNAELNQLVQDARSWPELTWAAPQLAPGQAVTTSTMIDIFLSYSRRDTALMHRLYADLREAGFSVWIDEGLEPGTASWKAAIEEAVRQAHCIVVVLAPNAKAYSWVNNEISFTNTFIPVLAAGDVASALPIDLINVQRVTVYPQ